MAKTTKTKTTKSKTTLSPEELKDLIVTTLDQDKAEDIVTIDLTGKTSLADYMVIASGRSTRQVGALAEKLSARIKKEDVIPRIEGKQTGNWVLVDAGDVIVHLFRPEVREFYAIEEIWNVSYPSDKIHIT
ncbi:MAG: ribosome silencing factor [Alphaproteobacteria bacterium]|nr:MAG: ribosome silencing factor [Alphaproteobacteria bacterium]